MTFHYAIERIIRKKKYGKRKDIAYNNHYYLCQHFFFISSGFVAFTALFFP